MQSLPVYIDGKNCGKLDIHQDGLMTVFAVQCGIKTNKIVRLYLYGDGKSSLLGTMQPAGEGLGIVRRFSRVEMKKLPQNIEYAADRPIPESGGSDTLWRRGKMGCLISDGLIAIPADETRLGRVSDKLRRIEGRAYLIFERKL